MLRIQLQQEPAAAPSAANEKEVERNEPIAERFAPEMEQLRRERDCLAKQCRNDALMFESRLTEMRQECTSERNMKDVI